jgi:ABC-type sugar transport system substrate-binding protein
MMTLGKVTRRAILALASISVAAVSAGFVATAEAKPIRIAAIVLGLTSEFNVLWADAAKAHPRVADGTVQLTIMDGRIDAFVQSNLMDSAITEKYDAVLFVPVDVNAGNAPVQRAVDAGIPVFGSNSLITKMNLYTSFINSDDVQAGEIEAKSVIDKMGGKGNVVIIEGPIGQSAQIQRKEGIDKILAANPDVKVLEIKTANWSRAEAQSLMENWLTAHPDRINGVIAENDEEMLGALQAVKARNIPPTKIALAGIDGITDALVAVKRGEAMTTLQDATGQAQGLVDLALRHLQGDTYKPAAALWDVNGGALAWQGGTARHYFVPWVPVTAANVDALMAMRKTH